MFRVKCRDNNGTCTVVKTTEWFAVNVSINEFDIQSFLLSNAIMQMTRDSFNKASLIV